MTTIFVIITVNYFVVYSPLIKGELIIGRPIAGGGAGGLEPPSPSRIFGSVKKQCVKKEIIKKKQTGSSF